MKNGTERYLETINYLSKLYDFANTKLFKGELERPVITVQADEKDKTHGWFVKDKIWKLKDDRITTSDCEGCPHEDVCTKEECACPVVEVDEGAYEINMTAQYLNRPIEEIAATLIHEMCHHFAEVHNVQDCSRSGTYHNKLFAQIAEAHGLTVEKVQTYGWSKTSLKDETKQLIAEFVGENPETVIYRKLPKRGAKVKTSSTRKYVCLCCGQSVRATKAVNIACVDCDALMREED